MKSMKDLLNIKAFDHFTIITNNYCNLYCEHCVYQSNIPINPKNENIFRREKWELSLDDLTLFCERFKGVGHQSLHFLSGGEPTAIPVDKLVQAINVLSDYRRRVALYTNGYNLMGIPCETINKIAHIRLSDHGPNQLHIRDCVNYLKSFYKGKIEPDIQRTHWDVRPAKGHPDNKGRRCRMWLTIFPILGTTIFPCCNTPCLMLQSNWPKMRVELNKAGWTTENENVVETIRDWRNTMPNYVIDQCLNTCYHPKINVGQERTKITLKPYSVIKKVSP